MKFILIFSLLSSLALAETATEKMRVTVLDDHIKKSDFPKDVKFDARRKKMSIRRDDRDNQFEKLKLTEYAVQMDELGRDLLYMDLKNNSIDEIIKTYPQIPQPVLIYAKNNFNK